MNFKRPGWFDRYQEFRRDHPLPRDLPTAGVRLFEQAGVHHEQDQAVYFFLQPTGLLYGFPVSDAFPGIAWPQKEYMDETGRALLIWLDALFACLVADRTFLLAGMHDENDPMLHSTRAVSHYFLGESGVPQGGIPGAIERVRTILDKLPIGRNRPRHGALEREIGRRLQVGGDLLQVPQYVYNGFLFLDLYYCLLWQRGLVQEPAQRHEHLGRIREEQRRVRETLLLLLVAAAHASGDVDEGEVRVFERFLDSAKLPPSRREDLKRAMQSGVTLEQIEIPETPWMVRRHLLDLTLMLILADRNFAESEHAFAAKLIGRLGLWEEELDQSQAALAAFLAQNEATLHFLRGRTQVRLLADRVAERAQMTVRKNLDRIVNEVRETKELYELLVKSRTEALTAAEKQKVRAQLFDILKTIPTLAIFALPGGSVVLPVLIRLLPFNLLPTSFED